jgi:uncharacterized membrane protein YhaH (DUF805 family)
MDALIDALLASVQLLNRIIVASLLITAFALIIYIGLYNRRSPIARAYAIILFCVLGTYLGDLLAQLSELESRADGTEFWLRLQWLGIATIPAASLAMSDALLRATGENSPLRRLAVQASLVLSQAIFLAALFTPLIATPGVSKRWAGASHAWTAFLSFHPVLLCCYRLGHL